MPSRIALRASVTGDTGATNALLGATPLPPFLQLDPDHDDEEEEDEVDLDHYNDDHDTSCEYYCVIHYHYESDDMMMLISALNMFRFTLNDCEVGRWVYNSMQTLLKAIPFVFTHPSPLSFFGLLVYLCFWRFTFIISKFEIKTTNNDTICFYPTSLSPVARLSLL